MANRKRIGIIAEDISDFNSLAVFIPKIKPDNYVFRRALGKGCGSLISKSMKFGKVLCDQGCTRLIVIRDSDGGSVIDIKAELTAAYNNNPIRNYVIVLAVQELESWLLSDMRAVHSVFSKGGKLPREISSPEAIESPKDYLRRLIKDRYSKQYLNTIHNEKIAKSADINKIKRKCPSFSDLVDFLLPARPRSKNQ